MLNEKITPELFQHQITFSSSDYSKLMDKKLFQLNPAAFDLELPLSTSSNWKLTLLGGVLEQANDTIEQLAEKNLQIKSIAIGEQTYATFLNHVKDLSDPKSYTTALTAFTSTLIEQAQVDIDEVLQKMPLNENVMQQLKEGIKNDVNKLFHSDRTTSEEQQNNKELQGRVSAILKSKGIPIDQKENSFYFSSTHQEFQWDVELFIPDNEKYLNCYASFPFAIQNDELSILLENMNDLNLAINTGNFQYNQSLELISFKSFSFITENNLSQLLIDLLSESETKILSLLPFADKLSIKS
jgi:hypothetical protein